MKINEKVASTISKIKPGDGEKKPAEVKIHRQPKTPRNYERVDHVLDFLRVINKHGDKVVYSYFDKKEKC